MTTPLIEETQTLSVQLTYLLADWTTIMIILGTLTDILPPIAAFLSIVWMCIRIYETNTVRRLLHRWFGKNRDQE